MSDKLLVLITGGMCIPSPHYVVVLTISTANQGLGYYAIQQMSATGKYHILMGARDIKKAEAAIKTLADEGSGAKPEFVQPIQIDMAMDESINAAAKTVEEKFGYLDVLMLNAGIGQAQGTLREHYRQVYDTNLFGTATTIEAFLPLLRKSTKEGGKRIAITSSDLASLELAMRDKGLYNAKNFPIYRSSKSAVNMVMCHYARSLEDEGVVVTASNPGFCNTGFNGNQGPKDPREGAKELVKAVELGKEVHVRVVTEGGSWRGEVVIHGWILNAEPTSSVDFLLSTSHLAQGCVSRYPPSINSVAPVTKPLTAKFSSACA